MKEPTMICSDCGSECATVECDDGIGPYEYGSICAVHHEYYQGSDCCGAGVEEGGSKVVEITHQVARKDYGIIKKGDYYRRKVERNWRKNGPSWVVVTRYIPVVCSNPVEMTHHNFLWQKAR